MRAAARLIGVLALTLAAGHAHAAELTLEFRDGLVTLVARDVSVRQILDEWATVGQTLIVNAEQASATPVTLQIDAVPERKALDMVLRSAAGYLAAPRREDNPGPSTFDRIMVLAVSNPPSVPGRGSGPGAFPPPTRPPPRLQVPAPLLLPADGDSFDLTNPNGVNLPPDVGGETGQVPAAPRPPAGATPFPRVPGAAPVNIVPGGSSVPGVVTPVPETQAGR